MKLKILKPITKAQMTILTMNENERELLKDLKIGSEKEMVCNPFTGVEVELCPEAVALYDLMLGCQILNDYDELFYTARDVFLRNWPDHYMMLID